MNVTHALRGVRFAFVVGPEAQISGRLTNLDGVPLSFESVELWDSSGRTVNVLSTNLQGEFAVGELLASTYFATVPPTGGL